MASPISSTLHGPYTVGQYLVDRLHERDVCHLFAIPGPHCAGWLHQYVEESAAIQRFGVTNAINAGYAADGYARINGLGAVCVPYSVGAFSLLNPIAGAFVERVPVVVINGAPHPETKPSFEATCDQARPFVGDPNSNLRVYENVTCAAERITDPERAPEQIDGILQTGLRECRPVYLEIVEDVFDRSCAPPQGPLPLPSEPSALSSEAEDTVETIRHHLRRADSVVVWGGIELQRYNLGDSFEALVRALDVPYVTSLLGKGLLPEDNEHFAGILDHCGSPSAVQDLVAEADYVLGVGVDPTSEPPPDFVLDTGPTTLVHHEGVREMPPAGPQSDAGHPLDQFVADLRGLLRALRTKEGERFSSFHGTATAAQTRESAQMSRTSVPTPPDDAITYQGFYDLIVDYVGDNTILMSGTGLDRFGSLALPVRAPSGFVSQAAYGDVGHVTPAAIGVDLGSDDERVLVFVGDGGFQMTAQCVGTMAEKGLDPIIFVLNNGVYGDEQRRTNPATFDRGEPFSPQTILQQWHYRKLPDALGGKGWRTETYGQLRAAVEEAFQYTGGPLLIDVRVQQRSLPALAPRAVEAADQKIGTPADAAALASSS